MSAATPDALETATDRLIAYLDSHPEADYGAVARTLEPGPSALPHRRVVVAASPADAAQRLRKRRPQHVFTAKAGDTRSVVFMFAGVGNEYAGMAGSLYTHLAVFRHELDLCFRLLEPELGQNLASLLYPGGTNGRREASQPDLAALFDQHQSVDEIHAVTIAQPLMFAVQYATARSLMAFGTDPVALIGYSLGEYVAACVAGVFTLDAALRVVAQRARLVAKLPGGAMLAVMSDPQSLEAHVGGGVTVAALEGPELTVLAGSAASIEQTGRRLIAQGIACRRLAASHAFHSPMMDPVAGPLRDLLATTELRAPRIPFLSNVTGSWITGKEATSPSYWAEHLRRTVRFGDALEKLWNLPAPLLIEFGPGQGLQNQARQHPAWPRDGATLAMGTLPSLFESADDLEVLLATVGRLWAVGHIPWPDRLPR